jgi:hypothetical protein
MSDWIDILGDAIFRIAELFMINDRPKRLVGVIFVAITAFGAIGTLIAVTLGAYLAPNGYFVLIPALMTTTAIAGYCFLTDRSQ